MIYQCGPDPEDVIAERRLSDGRTLAVFRRDAVFEHSTGERIVEAGGVRMRAPVVTAHAVEQRGFALVITDDTEIPEKWRTLGAYLDEEEALRVFRDFKEGDDDRRKQQTHNHPTRRASDLRKPLTSVLDSRSPQ